MSKPIPCCCIRNLKGPLIKPCHICRNHSGSAPHVNCLVLIAEGNKARGANEVIKWTAEEHFKVAADLAKQLYNADVAGPEWSERLISMMTATAQLHATMANALWTKELLAKPNPVSFS